jgi:hypothetical protein
MARPLVLPALAALTLAISALSADAKSESPATVVDDDGELVPDKIREQLSSDGYTDIIVLPTSYVVSATDKDGKRVLLLVGPASPTKLPEEEPGTVENLPGRDDVIQQ